MNWVLAGVFSYILLQLLVGVWVSRRIRSESDYLIAGRSLGLGLATFSIFATWFGAETCIGAAGKFYSEGFRGGITDPFGYTIALLLMGVFLARRLWQRRLTTLADLFRDRYSPGVERFAALMMAPTSVFWAAAQIRAFGLVLQAASGMNASTAVTLASAVVIVYTCTGGLMADVLTDFIQGIAIIVGLIFLAVLMFLDPGISIGRAWDNLPPESLAFFSQPEGTGWKTLDLWLTTIVGSVVAQEIVARILASRSPSVARTSSLLGGGMYLVIGLIPALLGLLGTQWIPQLDDPEQILPRLARQHLPTWAYILFTGAILSAILSTVDSTLLAASSLVSHNFVVSLKPMWTDRQRLLSARIGVVVFGMISYGLALGADTVFELVQQANGVGSAGIFTLMIFGLYASKFGGPVSGYAALTAGLISWALGTYLVPFPFFPAAGEFPYLVSMISAMSAFGLAGWIFPGRAKETLRSP